MTDGQQKFLTQPQPQLVRSGSQVKLKCVIANFGSQSQCRWQKDFKPVGLFSGKYSIDRDSQMTGMMCMCMFNCGVIVLMFSGDCSITINNVDGELDEGQWQCGATSSNVTLQDSLVSEPAWLSVEGELNIRILITYLH